MRICLQGGAPTDLTAHGCTNCGEKFYDERKDPHECTNLVGKTKFSAQEAALSQAVQKENKPDVGGARDAGAEEGMPVQKGTRTKRSDHDSSEGFPARMVHGRIPPVAAGYIRVVITILTNMHMNIVLRLAKLLDRDRQQECSRN
jgi:hypothetical protein